jgi:hypothetical protein
MDSSVTEEINSRYKTAISIEIAVLLVVLALAAAGWLLPSVQYTGTDLTPLWILILFIAAGSFVLRRSLTRWERLRDRKLLHGTPGLLKALLNNTIILTAISLVVALAGFVATIYSGDKFDMLRAAAVAIILLAVNFPRRKIWNQVVDALNEV